MGFLVDGAACAEELEAQRISFRVAEGDGLWRAGGAPDVLSSVPVGGVEAVGVTELFGLGVGDLDDVAIVEEVLVDLAADGVGKAEEKRGIAVSLGNGCGRGVEAAGVGEWSRSAGIAAADFLFLGGVDFLPDAAAAFLDAENWQPDWSKGDGDAYYQPVWNGARAACHG